MNCRRVFKWALFGAAWTFFMYFIGRIQKPNEQAKLQYRRITNKPNQRYSARSTVTGQNEPRNLESITRTNKRTTTTMTPYDDNAVAKRFENRLENLREECKRDHYVRMQAEWSPNPSFLFDIPHHLLVCAVPKSGSTSWHRTIWTLRRKRQGLSVDQKLYRPQDTIYNQDLTIKLPPDEGRGLLRIIARDDDLLKPPPTESTFRLVLARHPFARLISGWNQKFLIKSNYWVNLFRVFPKLLDFKKKIDSTHVMAFEDFARYVAYFGHINGNLDTHFIPAHMKCRPCYFDYQYILKAENVDADEPWLLRRLNLTDMNIGRKGIPPGGSVVNDNVKANIKKFMSPLHPEVIEKLYKIYEKDFQYFGYTFNQTTLEAGGF